LVEFGLVEFQDPEDAWHAQKNMNGAELFGKPIRVTFAKGIGFDEATGKETNTSVWESS
jgi:RNA recognition motif-containing protein